MMHYIKKRFKKCPLKIFEYYFIEIIIEVLL